jgi:hypothetical protein
MSKSLTHSSYKSAIAAIRATKGSGKVATWDSGGGWTGEAYWCGSRRRVVQSAINPDGMRIV